MTGRLTLIVTLLLSFMFAGTTVAQVFVEESTTTPVFVGDLAPFALYPDGNLTTNAVAEGKSIAEFAVSGVTPAAIIDFYSTGAAFDGWATEVLSATDGAYAGKKGGKVLLVNVTKEEGSSKLTVVLVVMPEAEWKAAMAK